MTQENNEEKISNGLKTTLDKHGFGFQYAVLRHANELSSQGKSYWSFECAEFPVVTKSETIHIDFVLTTSSHRTYLVGECKRVDPAKGYWCFAHTPYTWRNPSNPQLFFDQFRWIEAKTWNQETCRYFSQEKIYNLGFEQKTEEKGDGSSSGKDALNSAVTQVLRGSSGLINHFFDRHHRKNENEGLIRIIPAIFTTAQLWVTEADIGSADMKTGLLSNNTVTTSKVDWVWFNYNRSPLLSSEIEPGLRNTRINLSNELMNEFARTIAIIGPDGIDQFLGTDYESFIDV